MQTAHDTTYTGKNVRKTYIGDRIPPPQSSSARVIIRRVSIPTSARNVYTTEGIRACDVYLIMVFCGGGLYIHI